MTKHLADHRTASGGARLQQFIKVEKQSGAEGSHPSSRSLAQRAVDRSDAKRMQEFLRIERGETV